MNMVYKSNNAGINSILPHDDDGVPNRIYTFTTDDYMYELFMLYKTAVLSNQINVSFYADIQYPATLVAVVQIAGEVTGYLHDMDKQYDNFNKEDSY